MRNKRRRNNGHQPLPWVPDRRAAERLARLLQAAAREALLAEQALAGAFRQGADTDEPEGARFVLLSDTACRQLEGRCRRIRQLILGEDAA